jgi:hypothetical protein
MTPPVAKAKKRQQALDADQEALEEHEKHIPVVKAGKDEKPRNEVPTLEVINIMADEIQELYALNGSTLDEINARDKALILWRDLMMNGVHARDKAVPHVLCEEHS